MRLLNERGVATALWNMRVEFYKKGNPSPSNELVGKDPYKPVDYLDLVSQVKVERVLRMPFKRSQYYDWQSDFDKAQDPDQLRLVGENPGRGLFGLQPYAGGFRRGWAFLLQPSQVASLPGRVRGVGYYMRHDGHCARDRRP